MKKNLLLLTYCFIQQVCFSQAKTYWQQKVDYNITVKLNDQDNSLDANIEMRYYNNSPDTLTFIWIHLWPNAYKNDRTAFSDQLLENGRTDFYFSDESKRGYINRLAFKVGKLAAQFEDHPVHQDIIKLLLPSPLAPGGSVEIQTPFHVKLPYNFSRGGHVGQSYMATQWYPKPAVYDRKGWHEMPYLDQGEFYSEFGSYRVQLTLPSKYKVAATGLLQQQVLHDTMSTLTYRQDSVHDFAWFADKDFVVKSDTLQLKTKIIQVFSYYKQKDELHWKQSIDYIKSAIRTKSEWLGEYPYPVVSVVENSANTTGGGMEYPTITLVENTTSDKLLEYVIDHEIGHNWLYGVLATNERLNPWMDEGMNTFYDNRYFREKYGTTDPQAGDSSSAISRNKLPPDVDQMFLATIEGLKRDQPIQTSAEKFSMLNYSAIAYTKTGEWMELLEKQLGRQLFDSCMRAYYEKWQFKHPYPEDFKAVVEQTGGQQLDQVFALLDKKGPLEPAAKKDFRLTALFNLKDAQKHNYISFAPAVGYNNYDKLMLGLIIHNYSLPLTRFKMVLVPLYATNSKVFNGIGKITYSFIDGAAYNKIVIGINGERFSSSQSLDTFDHKIFEQFYKVVPSVKFFFHHRSLSHVSSWLDFRTYFVGQTYLTNFQPKAASDSSVYYPTTTAKSKYYLNEISFNVISSRVLYPYDYQVQLQQGQGFYRVNLTGNYFFNYASGGGLAARFFAAKFGLLGKQNTTSYLFEPRLLAATGYEDYTYSNYFVGRTAASINPTLPVKNFGLAAQQVMIRDGGLKFRFDQFDFLQGRSDNWVVAMNFNSSIPKIFPFNLPLKLFFDVGSYAEAWQKNAPTARFLYVGGLQLSLFKNILNIYAPILYSKDFKNQLLTMPDQNTFGKRLTFSIDLQNIRLKKLFPQYSL